MKAYEVRETIGIDGIHLSVSRPDPVPGPGQIVVRMHAAALNYRDHGVTRGAYSYTKFPVIPLSDGAGEVAAVGPEVTQFKQGDRVASTFFQTWSGGGMPADASKHSLGGNIDGVLAEYAVLPQHGAVSIPDHLSYEEAATLPCAALTAWHALIDSGGLKAGETVAILGTGGVSIFALQFAKLHGARVIVTSSSNDKLQRAKELGADALVNYHAKSNWEQDLIEFADGAGVDHIVEVGGAGTLEKSIAAVRPGGTIYVIGALAGAGSINPRQINRKAIRLQGIHVGSRDMFIAMNRAVAAARLRPVIDQVFEFANAKQAYAHQAEGAHVGKVVVRISP